MFLSRLALLVVAGLLLVSCQQSALEKEANSSPSEESTPRTETSNKPIQPAPTASELPAKLDSSAATGNKQCQIAAIKNAADVARFKQQCKALTECRLIKEESCYCPPGVQCVCGGGKGPQCVSKAQPLPTNNQSH